MARQQHRRKGPDEKEKALRVHSWRKALERYDLDLTDEIREDIIQQIQSGRSIAVEKQSERISVHDVQVEGRTVRVAYDKKRGLIVTFLYQNVEDYSVLRD